MISIYQFNSTHYLLKGVHCHKVVLFPSVVWHFEGVNKPKEMKTTNYLHHDKLPLLSILSIDGGGIRGVVPAIILAHIERKVQKEAKDNGLRIAQLFDLFVGTSAGGILSALYLTPDPSFPNIPKFSATQILEIYKSGAFGIFNQPLTKSNQQKYSVQLLEDALKKLLGNDNTLSQLLKPIVLTAYQLETKQTIFFQSWQHQNCLAWQVCRATSAAPGMFEAAKVDHFHPKLTFVDGSIFASNPALCAYTLANSLNFAQIPQSDSIIRQPNVEQMNIVSLGTGKFDYSAKEKRKSLIRMMMEQMTSVGTQLVDWQLQQLFKGKYKHQYVRMNPTLSNNSSAIDEIGSGHIQKIMDSVENYLLKEKVLIDKLSMTLLENLEKSYKLT